MRWSKIYSMDGGRGPISFAYGRKERRDGGVDGGREEEKAFRIKKLQNIHSPSNLHSLSY